MIGLIPSWLGFETLRNWPLRWKLFQRVHFPTLSSPRRLIWHSIATSCLILQTGLSHDRTQVYSDSLRRITQAGARTRDSLPGCCTADQTLSGFTSHLSFPL